ncbi:MAG: hypothetical protein LBP23_06765 [Treponema sp.]|nr:hypothetical protein [Treponema sp.]
MKPPVFLSLPLFFLSLSSLTGCASLGRAQTAEIGPAAGSSGKTGIVISDFPLWARDLRRAEIVAFGSFPFTMFAATFIMDTYRWAAQGGGITEEARRYAPWPFKSAGAIDMSDDEHKITMAAAASASVTIALLDHLIIQTKRHKARRRAESLPPGTPIIIRTPAGLDTGNAPGPEGGSSENEDPASGKNSLPGGASGADARPVPEPAAPEDRP